MRVRVLLPLLLAAAAAFRAPAARGVRKAPATKTVSPLAAAPGIAAVTAAAIVPTSLGFWKGGYAVSYGYGGAMAASAALYGAAAAATRGGAGGLAAAHRGALAFYGWRLCAFLLYREVALPASVHKMKARDASASDRLKRLPVVAGCGFLYLCMAAPLRVTHAVNAPLAGPAAVAVKLAYAGFGLAALGDTWKSFVKATRGDVLVTSGPFKFLRHPNYTGEMLGWTASFAAAVLAAAKSRGGLKAHAAWLAVSAVGTLGIYGVLAGEAVLGLEKAQRAKYGGTPEYEAWVSTSWAGPSLPAPKSSWKPAAGAPERVAWSGTCYPDRKY